MAEGLREKDLVTSDTLHAELIFLLETAGAEFNIYIDSHKDDLDFYETLVQDFKQLRPKFYKIQQLINSERLKEAKSDLDSYEKEVQAFLQKLKDNA